MQLILQAKLGNIRIGSGIQVGTCATIGHVDGIYILHQVKGFAFADVLMQGATELGGNIIFPVREGAGTAEAVHNGAGWTINAVLNLVTVNRAFPLAQRFTGFKYSNL